MPQSSLQNLKIISAGAGSGKTYRLTQELVQLITSGQVRATGIIATTFTRKAAAELQERVRVKLLEEGMSRQADDLTNALIGTVHGLGVKLLRRFSFEAGVSPQVDILPDTEQQLLFNRSLASVLRLELMEEMDHLTDRLGLTILTGFYDWRKEVKSIVDVCRANNFSKEAIENSRKKSWESFCEFLPEPIQKTEKEAIEELKKILQQTATQLEGGEDQTKVTGGVIAKIKGFLRTIQAKNTLNWHQWAAICKLKPGAKSRETVAPLIEFAQQHEALPAFRKDICQFIDYLFQTAQNAISEFQDYKTRRGLIDYTDMEVLVSGLLDHPLVQEVLADEIDLLLVDEFQDTSPIQLEIFLKLSQIAKQSIWVGDPKQSIYGFRGAEPALMEAIMVASGGIKAENIQTQSWRSRQDLVDVTNAIFKQAFHSIPEEQVTLTAVRTPEGNAFSPPEPTNIDAGIIHWHFDTDDDIKRAPASPWMENAIARALHEWLNEEHLIYDKNLKQYRQAQPGDVAILCRSNALCEKMAAALNDTGLRAAIAQSGLLNTAESRLVLACMKYVLNKKDALSVAEILMLAGQLSLTEIIDDRLVYLQETDELPPYQHPQWAGANPFIDQLDTLRPRFREMSSAETLDLLLEKLDLRRCIVRWGNREQRLSNIDRLRELAREYESISNNTHSAASLGGFLLWLNDLHQKDKDHQGASASPNAVNVLTYHKSKGLEWPVTVCHSLEQSLRADLWGISLISEKKDIDINKVLDGRWLRYWINPYASQKQKMPLVDRMNESEAQQDKTAEVLAEEIRLMYVGITRARDYIVFPSRERKPTFWLNRVCHKGIENTPALDPNTHESPWDWNGRYLDKTTRVFLFPRNFTIAALPQEEAPFLQQSEGAREYLPFKINPKKEVPPGKHWQLRSHQYSSVPQLNEGVDQVLFCQVVHLFLMALPKRTLAKDEKLKLAEGIALRHNLVDVQPSIIVQQADAFSTFLQQYGEQQEWQKRVPISWPTNGRVFESQADWLLQTDAQTIVGTVFFFSQNRLKAKITEEEANFYYFKAALAATNLAPVERCFVHAIAESKVIEYEFTK